MANRRYTSQFSYSFERMPVRLMGKFTQTGNTGVHAVKVTQGLTLTAVIMGSAGNSITIAFTPGATAGAEVVSVSGNAISVQIETGVSTVTQVRTALNAAAAAAALVTTTGTSASTVATAAALPLLTGADTSFTVVGANGTTSTAGVTTGMTLTQIGTGEFRIQLEDPYALMVAGHVSFQRSSTVDIIPQFLGSTTGFGTTQRVRFVTHTAGTAVNLTNGDVLYIDLTLRNSS